MGKDSRGVLRGRCNMPGCRCISYTRTTTDACSDCSHPPTKHLKLDRNSPSANVQNVPPTFPSQPQTQPSYPSAAYNPHGLALGGHSQASAVEMQYYTPSLKDCPAVGCSNKVHYDYELGPFDYCSPSCRDRHLLPQERERLKKDIEEYSRKMADLPPLVTPPPASPTSNEMVTIEKIEKMPKQELGIITAEVPDERGLLIVGFELESPAYKNFKDGKIKLLDVITQLNEEDFDSKEAFQRSTQDKTVPQLTLERKRTTPSIKGLLAKVKDKFPLATHIRILMNPFHFRGGTTMVFGIEPVPIEGGYLLGVDDSHKSCAHLSGVTIRDKVLMYATMNRKECKFPGVNFKSDISKAQNDGKHLILVLKREDYVY